MSDLKFVVEHDPHRAKKGEWRWIVMDDIGDYSHVHKIDYAPTRDVAIMRAREWAQSLKKQRELNEQRRKEREKSRYEEYV